jgi:hypothetical protein
LRPSGFEPESSACSQHFSFFFASVFLSFAKKEKGCWKAEVLPLDYGRVCFILFIFQTHGTREDPSFSFFFPRLFLSFEKKEKGCLGIILSVAGLYI